MKNVIKSSKGGYSEIFQNKRVKFSCCTEDEKGNLVELHTPFVCRDFLAEVLYGEKYKKKAAIWGFCFDGTAEQWMERPHLLVQYEKVGVFEQHLPLLHYYEDLMGLSHSELHKTNAKDTVLFIGDSAWKTSPWMISFYTLLIRMMAYEDMVKDPRTAIQEVAKASGNDADYCRTLLKVDLDLICKNWQKIHENAPLDGLETFSHKVSYMHDNCGIVGLARQILNNKPDSVWVKNYKALAA